VAVSFVSLAKDQIVARGKRCVINNFWQSALRCQWRSRQGGHEGRYKTLLRLLQKAVKLEVSLVQAIITGVRNMESQSGTTSANIISLSVQMIETQTGKCMDDSSTEEDQYMDVSSRVEPMNKVTERQLMILLPLLK